MRRFPFRGSRPAGAASRAIPRLAAAIATVALAGCAAVPASPAPRMIGGTAPAPAVGALGRATPAPCAKPAPASAREYRAAFAALPAGQWGAGDLSVSVPLPDGRTVWLFGDTFTGADAAHLTGFVHSTAVVQYGGCFHVSRKGAQVLPDDSPTRISWLFAGIALDSGHLLVASGVQRLTGTCAFCFEQVGVRGAILRVTAAGEVLFSRWLSRWPAWNGAITWGVGLARHGSAVVMYGTSSTGLARDLYVATSTVAAALRGNWRLGTRPVAHAVDPAGVSPFHDRRGWHLLTLRGGRIVRLDGPGPAGPFTERVAGRVSTPGRGHLVYLAAAHPEAKLRGGRLLVTICSNWLHPGTRSLAAYRPVYVSLAR